MLVFHAIAAMSENRVIGNQGKLPWPTLSDDFRWFKYKTMSKDCHLIMGRKTFDFIGKPLPGRHTLVLTRELREVSGYITPGIRVGPPQVSLASYLRKNQNKLYYVCGGAEIYRLLLPKCRVLYLTRVKKNYSGDTFFPPFEDMFTLDPIIRETDSMYVERWQRNDLKPEDRLPLEKWPTSWPANSKLPDGTSDYCLIAPGDLDSFKF